MEIKNHKFDQRVAKFESTDKHSGNFSNKQLPDTIVIHYTAGGTADNAVRTFKDPDIMASAHLIVDFDGSIIQMFPFNKIGWHAGKSAWKDRTGLNHYSIGIEIVNAGKLTYTGSAWEAWFGRTYEESEVVRAVHRNRNEEEFWHKYTEKQIASVFDICKSLKKYYDIQYILGHEEISPGRKIDPGPAFPMEKLRERLMQSDRKEDREPEESTGEKGYVNASSLNNREGPGAKYNRISEPLSRDTEVTILDENEDWYQVSVKIRGWVSKKYVERGGKA